jgi:hypothetical protein
MLYQWAYLQACENICVMSVASVFPPPPAPIFRVKFTVCALAEKPHMHLVSHEFMICFIHHFNLLLGLYMVDYLYVSFVKLMLLSYCISSYLPICVTFVVKVQNFEMLGVWVLRTP